MSSHYTFARHPMLPQEAAYYAPNMMNVLPMQYSGLITQNNVSFAVSFQKYFNYILKLICLCRLGADLMTMVTLRPQMKTSFVVKVAVHCRVIVAVMSIAIVLLQKSSQPMSFHNRLSS